MRNLQDLRPGYRSWPNLPASVPAGYDAAAALCNALRAEGAQVHAYPTLSAAQQAFGQILLPGQNVLLLESSTDASPTSWARLLQTDLQLRVWRFPARSARADLKQILTSGTEFQGLVARQIAPDTAEGLDLEEIFFLAQQLQPGIRLVADVSHSLGLAPYYHTAWGAAYSVYWRQQLGFYGVGQALPNVNNPAPEIRPAFIPYLLQLENLTPSWVWNQVHAEATHFRQQLTEMGARLTPQFSHIPITAFVLPKGPSLPEILPLAEAAGFRLGSGLTLHREPTLLVQHAPAPAQALSPLVQWLKGV